MNLSAGRGTAGDWVRHQVWMDETRDADALWRSESKPWVCMDGHRQVMVDEIPTEPVSTTGRAPARLCGERKRLLGPQDFTLVGLLGCRHPGGRGHNLRMWAQRGADSVGPVTQGESMKKMLIRSVVAVAAVLGFAITSALGAYAAVSYGYTLSGNGRMEYDASNNTLTGIDYKTGDTIYIRYGFTSTICGTSGSACAPSSSSTFRLQKSSKDYRESITVQPGSSTYIILKLCNDDAPPDTCSEWKRTSA